ncbi:coiled coil protein [Cryptosporidium ryanae]|uniref:coiled coil protein n=1 Tax=Cryptosporidium ryanae TaxID=515981 RepID=UPI00351A4A17|nr:coiled coil protein [Cryptosporidium ryanae]
MEEKLDLKSKYEKLRKKYTTLKQQFGELKAKTEKYENYYRSLNNSHKELESRYNECLANLDASQYKEAVLEREMEEIMCKLDQCKQQSESKSIQQNNALNKTGTGILTGLLPVNGVIKNFQRNEKLEERISILQEELDSKISENERLHIKEFDLKKLHKLEVDELTAKNEELRNEFEKTMNDFQELKSKLNSENSEIEKLKQKTRSNNEIIESLQNKLSEFESQVELKYNELRKLIPDVNIKKLELEHINWLNMCRSNYYFNLKKVSSLYQGFIELVLTIMISWEGLITNRAQGSGENELTDKININVLLKLNQAIKSIKYTKVIFKSNISFEKSAYKSDIQLTEDDNMFLVNSKAFGIVNEEIIEGFNLIYKALKLYILGFKIEVSENSGAGNALETKNTKIAIHNLSSLFNSLRYFLSKIVNMISFNIIIGKEPDIIYINSSKVSLYSEFLKLTDLVFSNVNFEDYFPEERHYFIGIIKQVLMGESNFTSERSVEIKGEILESIEKINKLEKVRRTLHSQINDRIQKYIIKFSDILSKIKDSINQIFNSSSVLIVTNNIKIEEYGKFFNRSISDLIDYIKENTLNNKKLISDLYQHPSKVFLSGLNQNEIPIIMRETQSKLLNTPRITLPELHILNKRIEQLEESKNKQTEVINNLKRQLNLNSELLLESDKNNQMSTSRKESCNSAKSEQSGYNDIFKANLGGNSSQISIQGISELLLREANETLEYTVQKLQLKINDLNDDINVTRRSYDEQISLLSQHICFLSEKLSQADASTSSSYNQEILCYSCETWNTVDSIMKKTKGGCEKCKTKLLRPK